MNLLKSTAFPQLESKRLLLRKPSAKDAERYHQILSYPQTSHYSDVPHQPTEKRTARFISWMSKLETRGTGVGWIICLRTNSQNEVIGSVRINRIEKKARCGVIGYELHPDYWSNGYATEALGKVVNYAHNQISLNRLEAWTCEGNDASDKVLLNNGFQYEGTQRDKAMLRGSYKNIRLYGRLASDQLTNR